MKEEVIDQGQSLQSIEAIGGKAELHGDRSHHLIRAHYRIEDERGGVALVEFLEYRPAKRRLARADLASELDEAFALAQAVEQVVERFAMLGAVKEEPRVRRDVEGRFRQPVVVQVHGSF